MVTNSGPPQVINPVLAGGYFGFSWQTVNGQSYTIQYNNDISTTNWVFYTNIIGNGSMVQVVLAATNAPQRFLRVREP